MIVCIQRRYRDGSGVYLREYSKATAESIGPIVEKALELVEISEWASHNSDLFEVVILQDKHTRGADFE